MSDMSNTPSVEEIVEAWRHRVRALIGAPVDTDDDILATLLYDTVESLRAERDAAVRDLTGIVRVVLTEENPDDSTTPTLAAVLRKKWSIKP